MMDLSLTLSKLKKATQRLVRSVPNLWRRQAEEALRASEQRYRSIFEGAAISIWEEDFSQLKAALEALKAEGVTELRRYVEEHPDFMSKAAEMVKIVDINAQSLRMFGAENKRELTTSLSRFFAQEAWTTFLEELVVIFEGRHYFEAESVIQTVQGERRNILLTISFPDRVAEFNRVIVSVLDITERKQAEEALRASEERFRQVIASISDHIYVTEVTEERGYVNLYLSPHAEALTGYPVEKFMADWSLWSSLVIHPEDRATAAAQMAQLVLGQNSETEYRLIRADKQVIWVRDSARVASRSVSKIIYGVVSDITERKQLEEQLRQSQKMEAIGRLAGGVAHDFNNLLTVIVGYSELALSYLKSDDPLRKSLVEIKKAGDRAASLTSQLLAFGRKQILQPKVLDLNKVVTDVERMLRPLIGEDIELITVFRAKPGLVKVDANQIEQVIINLAINARDAMLKGGTLTLETANVELDEDYVHRHPDVPPGSYVMLMIRDTGVGMDAETKSRIFEPFFTTKEQGKGTGLGLATVYGIVAQSGGHIRVSSEPEQGTSFKIYLPRLEQTVEVIKSD